MTGIECLKRQAELAFGDFRTAIEGVTEGQAWAVLPQGGPDYLHTDCSIHGIVLHVATAKRMYGSCGFRDTEVRWSDCANDLDRFEPSWQAAVEYLEESQRYFLETWSDLGDGDLLAERPNFAGKPWPAWKIIATMIHHDCYHAGQIAVLRYALTDTDVPPPSVAEDIRKYCGELVSW